MRELLITALMALLTIVGLAPAHAAQTATLAQVNTFLASVPADGGETVVLPDGRVLWLFGDTTDCPGGWCRNSYAIQSGTTFTRFYKELRPTDADGSWYWPGAPFIDGGHLVIPFSKMIRTGTGAFDFKQTGTTVVVYNQSTLAKISESTTTAPTPLSIVSAGGFLYLYSTVQVGPYHKQVNYSKVAVGSFSNPAKWSTLTKLVDGSWGAGTNVSVYKRSDGTYRLYSKRLDILGTTIISGDASSPAGTYAAAVTQYTPVVNAGDYSYNVVAHPEQVSPSGKIMVTYAVNGSAGSYHLYAVYLSR